ncbi:MAG: HU family DNA-binding protein [Patescibacteria group bacterium]|nr:HU family DNA-binding protein [Patescibacteria group bacterium]
MEALNRGDIVSAITAKTNQSKKDTEETVDALLEVITEGMNAGKKVGFTGFGAFWVNERKGRVGVNPQTGEKLNIPPTKVPKFKAGSVLKQAVK